jgi:hypothetical protein
MRMEDITVIGWTYSELRRDDFCDVMMTVIKTRTLTREEAALAVRIREWVLSGGDQRLSFPEWVAAESSARMNLLNGEWLGSDVGRRMSFVDWYKTRN